MIKKLFFTAALLVPGLAYGANPSANLPIQIVPASAVPAPAQAAGFNTLIINDNFQSATFADPTTWYDCAMTSGTPLYWRAWQGFGTSLDGPCGAVTQATDTSINQPALRIHYQDSYFNSGVLGHGTFMQTTDNNGNGRQTPPGFYLEVVARTDLARTAYGLPWMALWSYTTDGSSYEIDGFEEGSINTGGANVHNNPTCNSTNSCAPAWTGCPPAQGCGFDDTQYHTYAWRQTSAGTDIFFCAYIDGLFEGCVSIQPNSAELASGSGLTMVHQFAVDDGTGTPIGNGSVGKNTWIKSVKVWSCAAINSGALCRSSSDNP